MTDEELIAALREDADRVEPLARVPGCVPLTAKASAGWGAKVDDMILAMRETETDFRDWSPEAQDELACAALEAIESTQAPEDENEKLERYDREIQQVLTDPASAELEVVAWSYEYHDFGEIWPRGVILNRPDGGANPPTTHHGSPVRNVTPLVRQSVLTAYKDMLKQAEGDLSASQQEVEKADANAEAWGEALKTAEARNAELVKALEWYGGQARLARLIHGEGDKGRNALAADGGKRARAALNSTRS